MDLGTFILAERIVGSVSPVADNPTEPERPGTLHYLATMYRDGRSFATHVSALTHEQADVQTALRVAAERARRLEQHPQRDNWLRAAGIAAAPDDPLTASAAHAGEAELWHRAQQAEAQALRTFLGDAAYRELLAIVAPPALATTAVAARSVEEPRGRGRPRWLAMATRGLAWGLAITGSVLLLRSGLARGRVRRGVREALRRFVPSR